MGKTQWLHTSIEGGCPSDLYVCFLCMLYNVQGEVHKSYMDLELKMHIAREMMSEHSFFCYDLYFFVVGLSAHRTHAYRG